VKLEAIQALAGTLACAAGFAVTGVWGVGEMWVAPGVFLRVVGGLVLADYFLERVLTAWRTKAR
jgi:hypothetical protein